MGSYNATCAISHLPIRYDEPVVVLLMRVRPVPVLEAYCYPADLLAPLMPPFRSVYDAYGAFKDIPDEDWGLFSRAKTLETLKGNLVKGDDLFGGYETCESMIRANEWDFKDSWKEYPLAKLFVRADIWDYLLNDHEGGTWDETPYTFPQMWSRLEACLRAHIQEASSPDALDIAVHMQELYERRGHHMDYMLDDVHFSEGLTRLEVHAYCQAEGADLYLATPPNVPTSGMPNSIVQWMSHLMYDVDNLLRCRTDSAFVDKNLAGMKVLAEMVHVHLILMRLRRAWMPQGGLGSSRAFYNDHLQLNRKIVAINKDKARRKEY